MKKQIEFDNRAVMEALERYYSYYLAVEAYPWIDDIVHGVTHLDYSGNSRPLSKKTIFRIVSTFDIITITGVQAFMRCSQSNAQRYAAGARVASRAIAREFLLEEIRGSATPQTTARQEARRRDLYGDEGYEERWGSFLYNKHALYGLEGFRGL